MERRSAREIFEELDLGVGPRKREGAGKGKVEPKIVPRSKDAKRGSEAETPAADQDGTGKEEVAPKMAPKNKIDKDKFESINLLKIGHLKFKEETG